MPPASAFELAARQVIGYEGGYVWNAKDPGGETKYGISRRTHPNLDIKNLTEPQAREIYRGEYWDPLQLDRLPFPVALVTFDGAVNQGPGRVTQLLQVALNRLGGAPIAVDGDLGGQTRKKIMAMGMYDHERNYHIAQAELWRRIWHYQMIAVNPANLTFLRGWIARAADLGALLCQQALAAPVWQADMPLGKGGQ
ncbi:MAG: hypothetical protein C4570_03790 [Ammonifex sp.]|nr:MAG: hypothetical protein C4570_03790 [Ammonifex sp.]